MGLKTLCVDDNPRLLETYRAFHACPLPSGQAFTLDTALGPEEGLRAIAANGPYAVIVSDLQMPGMSGTQFLRQAQQIAPDSVRIMLTAYADQDVAIDAVNEAFVFRFLTKPCSHGLFLKTLDAGIKQYQLVTTEKELLEKTLTGAVQALAEVLALVNPTAFGRTLRIRRLVRQLGVELKVENAWQLDVASMLCQVGCVTVPEEVIQKVHLGATLTKEEAGIIANHPRIGHDLVHQIPRLNAVAEMIADQDQSFDGSSPPHHKRHWEIPLGARILKVALDFDSLTAKHASTAEAYERLQQQSAKYDPAVIKALNRVLTGENPAEMNEVSLANLFDMLNDTDKAVSKGMNRREMPVNNAGDESRQLFLAEDVLTEDGSLLLRKGQELTSRLLEKMRNYSRIVPIREPIRVLVPATRKQGLAPELILA